MADKNTNFHYTPGSTIDPGGGDESTADNPPPSKDEPKQETAESKVSWTAPEYIDHDRGISWYILLIGGTAVVALIIYMVTKDFFALGATVAAGILLAVFAGHKPRELTYIVARTGLKVGDKTYPYGTFKSFSVIREGEHGSINLNPIKKLSPPVTAYFSPQDETKVVQAIGEHLPIEEKKLDPVDKLLRRLKI
jgi:hypothetical protein